MPVVMLTRRHALIRRLTAKVIELERRAGARDARARVQVGGLLGDIRARLEHGEWLAWLDEDAPLARSSAVRFVALARWAADNAAAFDTLAHLGPSKLYAIGRLPPARVRQLLRTKRHQIPGTRVKKTLAMMTTAEVALTVAAILGAFASTKVHPSAGQLVAGYKKRIAGLVDATRHIAAHHDAIDRQAVADLHTQLVAAAEQLADAYDLE